jgi:peptidoglycan/xylan/chitin deacetylase (PgdA/CDA1 family)
MPSPSPVAAIRVFPGHPHNMIGKRKLAAALLQQAGLLQAIAALRAHFSNSLTILAYHRILDIADEELFPFDIELVSASVASFTEQMRYIKEHYTPLSFADILQCLDRAEAPPRGAVIVTFDDGFADNYRNAFPILKKFDIPATIFLSTGYIDSGEIFWYEKLSYAVLTAAPCNLVIPQLDRIRIEGAAWLRRNALKILMRHLQRIPDQARMQLLGSLFRQLSVDPGRIDDVRSGPMTWEQILEMSVNRIEFGSHGVSHPVLSMLDSMKLQHELTHSRGHIESMLGKPVQVLAYPVGGEEAFNETVRAAVKSAGYRLGVSYIAGIETPAKWDAYALRRLHVERYVDLRYFKAMLALPELFAYESNPRQGIWQRRFFNKLL